jgi:hypothetical protein
MFGKYQLLWTERHKETHETYRKEILRHTPRCNNPWQTGTPLLLKTQMAVKTLVFSGDSNTIAVVMFISIIRLGLFIDKFHSMAHGSLGFIPV